MIKTGQKPKDLNGGASVAYDATMELVSRPGPLSKQLWDAVVKEFGEQGALALVHYVGFYAYTCILLNGCDVPLPEGEEIMWRRIIQRMSSMVSIFISKGKVHCGG